MFTLNQKVLSFLVPDVCAKFRQNRLRIATVRARVMSALSLPTCLPNLKFVSLAFLELLAFSAQKFTGSRDPGHAHFLETFVRVMSGLSLPTCLPNLKFVSLAVLEILAFYAQKFTGSRDPGPAHFLETFVRVMSGLSLPTCVPNLKFVSLAFLELLAFTVQLISSINQSHVHVGLDVAL